MKTLHLVLAAAAFAIALPAVAGPDWQAIEKARTQRQLDAAQARKTGAPQQCAGLAGARLDHGPRAQTTPYLNQQRRERFDVASNACKDSAA